MNTEVETPKHIPVLFKPVIEWANARPGNVIIDATVGFGGHAEGLLEHIMPGGTYVGIDKDERAIAHTKQRLLPYGNSVQLAQGQFSNLTEIAKRHGVIQADVVLFDLGVSSPQLDDPSYGISLESSGEIDMRIGMGSGTVRAADILKYWSRNDLKMLFTEHGQAATNRIVERILQERERRGIKTLEQLKRLIEEVAPRQGRIHPATRVYQALRVVSNDEYGQLSSALEEALQILRPGGRLIVISFHSGEDRIVKQFLQSKSRGDGSTMHILTKKPIIPTRDEVLRNPRSRSAKMRVAEKIE